MSEGENYQGAAALDSASIERDSEWPHRDLLGLCSARIPPGPARSAKKEKEKRANASEKQKLLNFVEENLCKTTDVKKAERKCLFRVEC